MQYQKPRIKMIGGGMVDRLPELLGLLLIQIFVGFKLDIGQHHSQRSQHWISSYCRYSGK